jgi:hypothetical protein
MLQADFFLAFFWYEHVGIYAVFMIVFGEVVEFENDESVPQLFFVSGR